MATPQNILAAIITKWNATSGLGTGPGAMKLRYGRSEEQTTYPRAIYFSVTDIPDDAFSGSKTIDKWVFQFSVFDIDSDNVADLMDKIRTAYQRATLTITGGTVGSILKIGSGIMIEPKEQENSQNVYHGFVTFRFLLDG